jgi:2-polyprenyl-6-methoxyphenol hydroxylase-like FAD-dependent oxidoreductase
MSPLAPSTHDVIVVGARAGGAATAMLLARAGLDVVVVDRGRYGADTLSTHALMRAGVVQLHRWGLLDAVVAAGTPAVRRTTFTYADDEVEVAIKPAHGIDALYAPRRTVLDPILVDAARRAGARVEFSTAVTGVTRDRTGRVNGVEARVGAGRAVRHNARWVVGADGLRSVLARAVDAPVERQGTASTAVMYGYWSGLDTDGYQWVFRPHAFAGLIPTNDDVTCVFAAHPARIGRGERGVLREVVRAASPALADRLDAARPASGVRAFAGWPGYIRRPWGPGWALVGDAGYWKDPISAHGITDALRDAELLARAITAAATGGATETDAFGHYHEIRDSVSHPLFDVVDTIAGGHWTDAEIPGLLRQLSASMSDEVELVAGWDERPALVGARTIP